MAEQKVRGGKGKKRPTDKWKKKTWYKIIAPKEFDEREIGQTISGKPELVKGRVIRVSTRELAGAAKKQFVTLLFKVVDVKGDRAHTEIIGHEMHESYIKRLVRRRKSKIQVVQTAKSGDGVGVKLKTIAITGTKVARPRETAVNAVIRRVAESFVKSKSQNEVVAELVFGNLPQIISKESRNIAPLKRVEIVKSRIIRS